MYFTNDVCSSYLLSWTISLIAELLSDSVELHILGPNNDSTTRSQWQAVEAEDAEPTYWVMKAASKCTNIDAALLVDRLVKNWTPDSRWVSWLQTFQSREVERGTGWYSTLIRTPRTAEINIGTSIIYPQYSFNYLSMLRCPDEDFWRAVAFLHWTKRGFTAKYRKICTPF